MILIMATAETVAASISLLIKATILAARWAGTTRIQVGLGVDVPNTCALQRHLGALNGPTRRPSTMLCLADQRSNGRSDCRWTTTDVLGGQVGKLLSPGILGLFGCRDPSDT